MTQRSLLVSALVAWAGVVVVFAQQQQYAAMQLPDGLSPRYYLGAAPNGVLQPRADGLCVSDSHSCLDVNATACCLNTEYCIIKPNPQNTQILQANCCQLGSECGISCGSTAYLCTSTATVSGTATATTGCCPRACTASKQYRCGLEYGGGCCAYGFSCGTSSSCISTASPTTSSPIVSAIPSGCTTNQYSCASSLGGGCCDNGQVCTVSNSANYCAVQTGTALRTRTGPNGLIATIVPQPSESKGLSTGAKAGIGVGVSLGAVVVIGAILWFFLVHRRRARQSDKATSVPPMSQAGGSERPSVGPRQASQPSDYFGPAAVVGPYTEVVSPPALSPGSNNDRGVPATPQSPGDIAVPVEIDSRSHSNVASPAAYDDYQKKQGPHNEPIELP